MFQNLDAYKLKIIAIIGMIASHMAITWWDIIPVWLALPMYASGGLTFPIMGYFVAEGYKHTSNLKKYILRILMFGVIALPLHIAALTFPMGGGNPVAYPFLNIMFTIILGLLSLYLYDKIKSRVIFWIVYIIVIVPVSMLFEWWFVGTTVVLLSYIILNEKARRVVPSVFAGVLHFLLAISTIGAVNTIPEEFLDNFPGVIFDPEFVSIMPFFLAGCLLAGFLLYNYNGERGKSMKYLFYIIYPVHFAVLVGVALALGIL